MTEEDSANFRVPEAAIRLSDDFEAALVAFQEVAARRMQFTAIGTLGLTATALCLSGPLAKTAICLAIACGMAWAWRMVDQVCAYWLLELATRRHQLMPCLAVQSLAEAIIAECEKQRAETANSAGSAN